MIKDIDPAEFDGVNGLVGQGAVKRFAYALHNLQAINETSMKDLAAAIGVAPSTLRQWMYDGDSVGCQHVPTVEYFDRLCAKFPNFRMFGSMDMIGREASDREALRAENIALKTECARLHAECEELYALMDEKTAPCAAKMEAA